MRIVIDAGIRGNAALPGAEGLASTDGEETKRPRAKKPRARRSARDSDVANALRSIYQKTVHETVPAEMLDLLDKLD